MATQPTPTKLDENAIGERLREHKDWRREGDGITRTLKFKDFREAKAFVDRVAEAANEADHHPDIHLENYNEVRLVLSTHSIDGLSQGDFTMAARIDKLVVPPMDAKREGPGPLRA